MAEKCLTKISHNLVVRFHYGGNVNDGDDNEDEDEDDYSNDVDENDENTFYY